MVVLKAGAVRGGEAVAEPVVQEQLERVAKVSKGAVAKRGPEPSWKEAVFC